MATYYLDFENGSDAGNGTSFATRWKTITSGATAARIAPGDEIRIMASPDPTAIGDATWTGGGRPSTINISSSSTPTVLIVSAAAHGLVTGDYVMISGNSAAEANGVWMVGTITSSTIFQILQMDGSPVTSAASGSGGTLTKLNNCIVKTASPLVKNIALCGGSGQKPAWTASTNAAAFQDVNRCKEGSASMGVQVTSTFTTGKAAYYTLPSTLDLSAFQQVSFWVQLFTGSVGAAGQSYLALCSDTAGSTVVHQCPIPALGATGQWVPVTVDFGTGLSSTINSVAFYIATDNGQQIFNLDNIIACKARSSADSINLQSLISKSDGTGDEAWYAIQSINHNAIMLGNANSNASNSASIRGYNGVSETIATYKRETVKTTALASGSASTVNDSGTSGSEIVFSGGWNRTDMSTQTGRTWLDGQNGVGNGINITSRNYITLDRLDFCRYNNGVLNTYTGNVTTLSIGSIYATACTAYGISFSQIGLNSIGSAWLNNNGTAGMGSAQENFGLSVGAIKTVENNSSNGIELSGSNIEIGPVLAGNSGTTSSHGKINFTNCINCVIQSAQITNGLSSYAVRMSNSINCYINGGSSSNGIGGVNILTTGNTLYLNNFTIAEAAEVVSTVRGYMVYANRLDNSDGNNWVFSPYGTVNQQASVVDAPATTAWKLSPTTANATAVTPVELKLGTVVCAANSQVTVTARMRRSNTGLTMRLVCPGGQISGVSSDVAASMTAAADTWETVTITFTPTKAGGVDIYAYAFGGTTFSGYVCNLTAAQA